MIKRKKIMAAAICAGLAAVQLMACGQSGGETAKEEKKTSGTETDTQNEPVELRIWHGFTSETTKPVVEEIFERYNEVQDDVKIVYDAFSSSDLLQAYTLGAVSGELPDIGVNDNPAWASLCEMGVFRDIDEWFKGWEDSKVFMDSIMASGYYEDKVYGVPFGPNCLALWCNTEMLNEAGYTEPPKTFDEFVEVAKATTNPDKGVYGFVMGAFKDEAGTYQNLPWLMSAGGDIFDLTSAESKSAMQMLKDLYDGGNISQESLNLTQSDALNQFMAGNAAMYVSGSWNVSTIRNNYPDFKFTCSPIPKKEASVSSLGGELMGITTACEHVEEAEDFMEWFLSYDINKEFAQRCTRFSPRSDISAEDLYPGDEVMAVYAELLPNAYARGPHPSWSEVSGVFQTSYQEIYTGAKGLDESLKEAAEKIEGIINQS